MALTSEHPFDHSRWGGIPFRNKQEDGDESHGEMVGYRKCAGRT